ncbi:unnamed protein product [Pylaiella littoralis]
MRTLNATALYVNQVSRRNGSIEIYLEPWDADVLDFLDMKKNTGGELQRVRDLFYALWVPNTFMERVENNGTWSLFCPHEAHGLSDVYGPEFEWLYKRYEERGIARKVVQARDVWNKIIDSQVETGTPYMLYKDHQRQEQPEERRGNQMLQPVRGDHRGHVGRRSRRVQPLFDEPPQFRCLPARVRLQGLGSDCFHNRAEPEQGDRQNVLSQEEARKSNLRHRPIGVGVQGLADVFALIRLPFESEWRQASEPQHLRDAVLRVREGFRGARQDPRRVRHIRGAPRLAGTAPVRPLARGGG